MSWQENHIRSYEVPTNEYEPRYDKPRYDKTNKVTVRPAKTQFSTVRSLSDRSSLCAQAKDPSFLHADSEDSDWADAQSDLSLRWAHSHIVGFVMSRLISEAIKFLRMNIHSGDSLVQLLEIE